MLKTVHEIHLVGQASPKCCVLWHNVTSIFEDILEHPTDYSGREGGNVIVAGRVA